MVLCSQVDKPSKILIKTSNAAKYIESDIQNIETPKIDDLSSIMNEKIYLHDYLKGVLEAIQVCSLYQYSHGFRMVGSPLQNSSPREKEKKVENSHQAYMGTLSCGHSLPIYKHLI